MALNKVKFSILFAVSALSLISAQSDNKLHIDVHYESLCPDSRNFIHNQLKRTYPKIKDSVVINYVPFGKSYSYYLNGETLFSCQHGVRECEGNRFQSCALDVIGPDDQDKQTEFVICAMDFLKIPSNCATTLGLDLKAIENCYNGERGIKLQLEAEKFSKDIIEKSGFVPSITYGHKYNARSQRSSLDSFHEIVKEHLQKLAENL